MYTFKSGGTQQKHSKFEDLEIRISLLTCEVNFNGIHFRDSLLLFEKKNNQAIQTWATQD